MRDRTTALATFDQWIMNTRNAGQECAPRAIAVTTNVYAPGFGGLVWPFVGPRRPGRARRVLPLLLLGRSARQA